MIAIEDSHKRRFDKIFKKSGSTQMSVKAAFHLHPNVRVRFDRENNRVSLALKNGELWFFNYSLDSYLQLEPTIFFENGLFEPLESKKLILSTELAEYGTKINWSLTRALDKDLSVGDFFSK